MSGFNTTIFKAMPIVGIIRNYTFDELVDILPVYAESGLTTLEITMNTPDAAKMIAYAADRYGARLNIGAGTVVCMADLDAALHAGAGFIVMPVIEEMVILACERAGIPVFPGAMTPTEIAKAWHSGATMVKVFPAATLGSAYFKDVLAPLSYIELMATGGIDLDNLDEFWQNGVRAFGIGSPLFLRSFIVARDWKGLAAHFGKFAAKMKDYQIEDA